MQKHEKSIVLCMMNVQYGIDRLIAASPPWKNQRIALVTNYAATTAHFQPSAPALIEHGFNLVRLFSPEHGLNNRGADGHAMQDGMDTRTGLPVISLYGDKLMPAAEDLADIDIVLFDIPDLGVRFYTFLWTLTHVMEACALYDKTLILLDRPNPLSGIPLLAEGPMLDESSCGSFIGRWDLPVRHSCSLGELAAYFNAIRGIHCRLELISCINWSRSQFYTDHHHSFVPTSPAITHFESALLYPALCFLEATNICEGRGTPIPFRMAGTPWMNPQKTADLFNDSFTVFTLTGAKTASVYARPMDFTPAEGKYAGQVCRGIMLHVNIPAAFLAVSAGLLLVKLIKDIHPDHFGWAPYPTHVNTTGARHLDLLTGIRDSENLFELPLAGFILEIKNACSAGDWMKKIGPFLLYG